MAIREIRILILMVGGNISLHPERNRGAWELKPVSATDLKKYLLGEDEERLLLREKDLEGEWVRIGVDSLEEDRPNRLSRELKDSSGIDPEQWQRIATRIHQERASYNGFVILHGLDTMAYTASAISFMLRYLNVPVIFTGSQIPLKFSRTDALQNILCAVTLASQRTGGEEPVAMIPEVCIFAHDTLFRANRTRMTDPSSYSCFGSSNYPPLAKVGEYLDIHTHLIRKPARQLMRLRRDIRIPVHILDVYPGIDSAVLTHLFEDIEDSPDFPLDESSNKPRAGLLLRTYGMGTAPVTSGFLEAIETLNSNGVVIMAVSQAHMGHLSLPRDPVSLRLLEHGVVFGADMTAEAAYAKLKVFLSSGDSIAEVKEELTKNQAGEQSRELLSLQFIEKSNGGEKGTGKYHRVLEANISGDWHQPRRDRVRQVQLRVLGLAPEGGTPKQGPPVSVEIDVEVIDRFDEQDKVECKLLEDTLRWDGSQSEKKEERIPNTENRVADITHHRNHVTGGETLLRIRSTAAIEWKRVEIVFYMDVYSTS